MNKQTNTKKPGAKPANKQTEARAKLATPPPPVEVAETVAAELPGTSPEEVTRAAQAVAIRDANRHKQNAERYASLAVVFNPGIKADEATRRAMLEKAGWIAPAEVSREMEAAWGEFAGLAREANESAERGLLAAIQNDPGAWQVFADEAKKEEALRDAALARAEKAGDVLRQLQTDKVNAELAAALRSAATLHETVTGRLESIKCDTAANRESLLRIEGDRATVSKIRRNAGLVGGKATADGKKAEREARKKVLEAFYERADENVKKGMKYPDAVKEAMKTGPVPMKVNARFPNDPLSDALGLTPEPLPEKTLLDYFKKHRAEAARRRRMKRN